MNNFKCLFEMKICSCVRENVMFSKIRWFSFERKEDISGSLIS